VGRLKCLWLVNDCLNICLSFLIRGVDMGGGSVPGGGGGGVGSARLLYWTASPSPSPPSILLLSRRKPRSAYWTAAPGTSCSTGSGSRQTRDKCWLWDVRSHYATNYANYCCLNWSLLLRCPPLKCSTFSDDVCVIAQRVKATVNRTAYSQSRRWLPQDAVDL
jgi:hypothetical protein